MTAEIELKPCPCCAETNPFWSTISRIVMCPNCGLQTKRTRKDIAFGDWNRRSPPERDAEETLNRYRYAAQWAAADSWDGCGDCRQRLQWAMELDDNRLDANSLAAVGKIFLAQTGRALAKHSPESK